VAKKSSKRASLVKLANGQVKASAKGKKAVAAKAVKPVKGPRAKNSRPVKKSISPKKVISKAAGKKSGKPVKIVAAKASNAIKKPAPVKAKPAAVKVEPVKPVVVQAKEPVKPIRSAPPLQIKPVAIKPAFKSAPLKSVQIKPEPYQMQPTPAVATNLKPRKSQIGLGVRELEHYADLLLAKRRELVGDMSSMEREALRSGSASNLSTLPVHMADMGTDNYEQEFTLGLVEKDRNLLREINHALAKIQNGTYGICEGTGNAIGKPRLEAQPWARFSIEYARQREKNGMGVRTL
jgi:DnaK suppressor protein